MSRRSSFGYSSYGSRSYRSRGYRGNRRSNKGKKAAVFIIIVLLLAGAACGLLYYFVWSKNSDMIKTEESSQVSESTSSPANDVSDSEKVIEEESKTSKVSEVSQKADIKGYKDGNVFIYDSKGYELFYGTDESAQKYADTVSSLKKTLGKDIKVYNLVAPTHSPFGLPKKYLAEDEKANIKKIYSSYTEDVIPIDVYNAEDTHKEEYTYFKTDSNWTALGAYYAYQEFCKTAKLGGIDLTSLSKGNITGFKGSHITNTKTQANPNGNKELLGNPDTVIYYNVPGVESCILLEKGESTEKEVSMIASFAEGANAYSAFIWGDNPYMKVKTSQKTGKKLCIIKDSYGCAFAPFTAANYDEIYIIDPRYYTGSVTDYIKKNKFTDVLVINSVSTANYDPVVKSIQSVIK